MTCKVKSKIVTGMIQEAIIETIRKAAAEGDNAKLDSLAKQFPEAFANACGHDLLNVAHTANKPDTVVYLMVKHHCLVDAVHIPFYDVDLFGERCAQLHRSLEVLADAARGHTSDSLHAEVRNICCYDVRNAVNRAVEGKMSKGALSPVLTEAAANGDLQGFVDFVFQEELKGQFTLGKHSGSMLRVIAAHIDAIAAYAPERECKTAMKPITR